VSDGGGGTVAELPPLDPEVAAALAEIPEEFLATNLMDFDDLPASRDRLAEVMDASYEDTSSDTVTIEDVTVPGPSGDGLRLRVHRPVDPDGPLPCVYWMHLGGMVSGRVEDEDATAARLVEGLDCVVVAVDYRLAPEHPYPAPVDDCYAGFSWIADNAEELDVDASRLALAGLSAGGGLAAAVALRARDDSGPEPCLQMMLCPMLDDRNDSISCRQVTDIGIWDRDMNVRAWEAYLGERSGGEDLPPDASPARAEDLAGLPPAYLDVGTHDLYRDETMAYAARLAKSGVLSESHLWPGCFHGFDVFAPEARVSQTAWRTRIDALERAFEG